MVLIAYDGSAHSRLTVEAAAALLDGPATVLHVWTPIPQTPVAPIPGPIAVPITTAGTEDDPELARRALRIAQEGADLACAAGLSAEPLLARGSGPDGIARRIVEVAEERGAQAIVVGRRGVSRLQSAVLGSVSHEVVLHSPVPVLVTPPLEHGEH